eukprot:scaffold2579_cov424-Pavlova_lutheri.AAC.1
MSRYAFGSVKSVQFVWLPAIVHYCSVQVGSRTGDTCATSELRLSAVVEILEEADGARRSSRRTSRK